MDILNELNRASSLDATKGSADVVTEHGSIDVGTLYHETGIEAVCVLVDIVVLWRSQIPISERFAFSSRLAVCGVCLHPCFSLERCTSVSM